MQRCCVLRLQARRDGLAPLQHEAEGACGFSCNGARRFDLFAEEFVEINDEILVWPLFYDVADLPRQVH